MMDPAGDHNHTFTTNTTGGHNHIITTGAPSNNYTGYTGDHNHTFTTSSVGSGTAHNNMPPYLAVYMWKRTA